MVARAPAPYLPGRGGSYDGDRDDDEGHPERYGDARSRDGLESGPGPRRGLRRPLRLRGAIDRRVLPAHLPVAPAPARTGGLLCPGRRGPSGRVPRLSALPTRSVADPGGRGDVTGARAHRRPPRPSSDPGRARRGGGPQPRPPAADLQGAARPLAARLPTGAARRALQVGSATGPHRNGRALRGRLRVRQPAVRGRPCPPRHDPRRLQARRQEAHRSASPPRALRSAGFWSPPPTGASAPSSSGTQTVPSKRRYARSIPRQRSSATTRASVRPSRPSWPTWAAR